MKSIGLVVALSAVAAAPAFADPTPPLYFNNPAAFVAQCISQGKTEKGIENFEEAVIVPGSKNPFPNPLQQGTPRPGLPNGIGAANLIIQSNITPMHYAPTLNPSSDDRALWINGAGFIGSNSIKVGTDEFLYNRFSSLDLIFTSHDKTGIGFDMSTFAGFNQGHVGFDIGIFDDFNNLIGTAFVPAAPPEPTKSFLGIWSAVPIGRVNVWGIFAVPQPFAVDNIQMWTVPAPGVGLVLGLGGLVALRRRR